MEGVESIKKQGFITTTYKFRIYIKEIEYLKLTNEIYNEIVKEYYNILIKKPELLELSNHNCLRELEILTVKPMKGERKGIEPEYYFEQEGVPLYLRRAAINTSIGLARIYFNLQKANETSSFKTSTTFYKGMYKNLENGKITLKLFNGETWKWYKAKLKDWKIPENAEVLSPTIVMHKNYVMAHIPIKTSIEDITPIRYRMQKENTKVCGIIIPNMKTDTFAVCVILDEKGKFVKSLFIKDAKEYEARVKEINNKIRKDRKVNPNYSEEDHKNYWKKINNIKNYYAHKVSKKIVNFCKENNVQVIAKPNYKRVKQTNENMKMFYEAKRNRNTVSGLSTKILTNLDYKAFKEGILTTRSSSKFNNQNMLQMWSNSHQKKARERIYTKAKM